MTAIATSIFTGISTAALLFLVASGMTLIFGAMRVINVAHGSLYMLGAYLLYQFSVQAGMPIALAVPVAAIAVLVIAIAIERTVIRYTYGKEHLIQLLATYALTLVIADIALIIWGTNSKSVQNPLPGSWSIAGMTFPIYSTVVILIALCIGLVLWLVLARTRVGWMIRASSENPATLSSMGYNVSLLNVLIFGVGGALAGLGGAIYAPMGSVAPGIDNSVLVNAFVVTVVGGLGSIGGAAVVALGIGVLQGVVLIVFPSLSSSLIYIIMIVSLAIRPWGLFGRPER